MSKSPTIHSELLKRGLPANIDAERFILGSILLNDSKFASVTGAITAESFALEKHRRIWTRMEGLAQRSETIDRVTLANELLRFEELESVDGISYLVSLDDGMPNIANLDSYVKIVVEKYRLRKIIGIAERVMNQALLQEDTADDISAGAQGQLSEKVGGYGSSNIESVREYVENYPGGINNMLDPSRWDKGIPTGITELDEWCDGFHASEIFVIGARPATGKTALASCLAKNIAQSGKSVAFFSLELSKKMLLDRMICEQAYLSYSRYRRGELDDADRRRLRTATNDVMDLPIYIDDNMGTRISDIRVKLDKIARERPVDLIVVDYAQLIKPARGKRFNSENDKFTDICEEIKILTKSTGIPMLLLSQLNRESEKEKGDTKPKLSQCRGAGAFEEMAYLGACLYREYVKKREREDLRDVATLIVDKNRSGRSGEIQLRFQGWLMRFSNAPEVPEQRQMAA